MSTNSATAPAMEPGKARLVSLDAFRGFTMFWLMGGKGFLIALAAAAGGPLGALVQYQLNHSAWEGLRYYDLIWPSFMLMVGVSVPFSMRRNRGMAGVWKRAAVLFLLGSLRESLSLGTPCLIELSSALQPIAVAYVAAAYLARRGVRVQAAAALLILAAYALVLALVPPANYELQPKPGHGGGPEGDRPGASGGLGTALTPSHHIHHLVGTAAGRIADERHYARVPDEGDCGGRPGMPGGGVRAERGGAGDYEVVDGAPTG